MRRTDYAAPEESGREECFAAEEEENEFGTTADESIEERICAPTVRQRRRKRKMVESSSPVANVDLEKKQIQSLHESSRSERDTYVHPRR